MKYSFGRKTIIRKSMGLMLLLLMTLSGCEKNEIRTFQMGSDNLTATDESGTKLYLNHLEQWLYWEEGDQIYVFTSGDDGVCDLISGANSQTATFKSATGIGETGEYAIYPASAAVEGQKTQIKFLNEITYNTNRTIGAKGTDIDSSFAKDAMPMVSDMQQSAAVSDAAVFHVVAGIVRLQLFASSTATMESIEFQSVAKDAITKKQISGVFTIGAPADYQPYVIQKETPGTDDYKITITDTRTIGPSGTQLLTYYIPLPATSGDGKTTYAIRMKVKSNAGYCVKNFTVDIHRRNITMLPALQITSWATSDPGDEGTGGNVTVNMVGHGTKDRPFQIYDVNDLVKVRTAMNASPRGTINGQTITSNTYFRIVRSDIELTTSNWNAGINDFIGHIYFAANSPTQGNITNNSNAPIFNSINANGEVSYFYVKTTGTKEYGPATNFSLLCNTNNGTLLECHNLCNITLTSNHIVAGLCVTNSATGKIIGGANEGLLKVTSTNAPRITAGICAYNQGEIQGNFTVSAAVPVADSMAGICYENSGTVHDCLVNVQPAVTTTGHWGTVVFRNLSGGTVHNCIGNGSVSSGRNAPGGAIGGIVYRNWSTISNSKNNLEIYGGYGSTGGIVAYQHSGITYNCYSEGAVGVRNNDGSESTVEDAGGIVGNLIGGTIANSYNRSTIDVATNAGGIVGRYTGGTIVNCWTGYEGNFCGIQVSTDNGGTEKTMLNCFSRNSNDYTNGVCTLFETTTDATNVKHYTIKEGKILTRDATYATTAGELLMNPLNRWRTTPTVTVSSPAYYEWTQPALTPVFKTTTKGRSFGRR